MLPDHTDERGAIARFQDVSTIFTVAGALRSGDIHPVPQHDMVIRGTVEIKTPTSTWTLGSGEHLRIPAGVPHLFTSITDSVVCEWWDGEFEAEYYAPYRVKVEEWFDREGIDDR